MKQKKENRIALLLQWAGEQKIWLLLAILLAMASGLCIIVPYIGIYRLMDAAFQHISIKVLTVLCSRCAAWWRNIWQKSPLVH